MDSLDRAIDLVSRWKADRNKQRADVVTRLEGVIKDCEAAGKLWQDFLDRPGAPGDERSLMSWAGPDRARRLHEINLQARAGVAGICRLAGPAAGRFAALDEEVIEMAYRQLQPGESGMDAARTAVQNMQACVDYLKGLIKRAQSARAPAAGKKPAKKAGKTTVKKKAAKRKTAARPAKKKAAPKKK